MQALVVPVLIGLIGGIAIGLQNPLASLMGQRVGILGGAFVIHLGGAVFAGLILLAGPGSRLTQWRTVPWYALAAGVLGVILISAISFTIPRIGIAATVALIVTAQLTIGAWLDHHGLLGASVRSFDAWRMVGIVLLLGGTWLVVR